MLDNCMQSLWVLCQPANYVQASSDEYDLIGYNLDTIELRPGA